MRSPERLPPTVTAPFPWKQGEHMFLSGDTGSGKSLLASHLLTLREHYLVVRTKPDDVQYLSDKVVRTRPSQAMRDMTVKRLELRPPHDLDRRIPILYEAYNEAFRQGGWCVYGDERWMLERYGLTEALETLDTQGRSKGVTNMTGAQRPVEISRFGPSQATHVITFGHEGRDAKTLMEICGGSRDVYDQVRDLRQYEFLWWYRRTKQWFRGKLQDILVAQPQEAVA